ncbi:MAG: HD domain-containing protein, partial [Bacteroidales bacterium]|nr:HD domain-containing protein [Bacteroidales bacterium]
MNNDKDKIRQQIYLGALLHDIGKFVYRSKKNIEKGHEEHGEQFIREYFGKIKAIRDDIETIINESKHHKIQTYTAVADRIAASERDDEDEVNPKRPLLSVLNSISLGERYEIKKGSWYFKP